MTSHTWLTLLAYEARIRHAADSGREEARVRRLAAARSRVVAHLRCAMALDIEGFVGADGDSSVSALTCQNGSSVQGFVVSRMDGRIRTRRHCVDLEAGTLSCRYDNGGNGTSDGASDRRVLAIDIGDDGSALTLWDDGVARRFATVDVLSAFLLAPILAPPA
jgi:hypothetical protein